MPKPMRPYQAVRICELVFTPSFGGAETLALELASEFRQRGHDVVVAALEPADRSDLNGFGADVVTIGSPGWVRNRKLKRLIAARRLLSRGEYDIIHTHSFFPNLYVRAAAAFQSTAPIVTTLHSASDDFSKQIPRALERMLANKAATIVAVSSPLQDQYVRYFPRSRDRTTVIPNGVRKFALRLGDHAAKPSEFAVIGRVTQQKDLETVIRGFASFATSVDDPGLTLHVIGPESEPAYAREVREIATAARADGKVVFHGPVRDPFGQKRIDVVVHGAPQEGHPITILEAAARGIPVVCPLTPTVSGSIDDRCTTFAAGDPRDLCNALLQVYSQWPVAIDLAAEAWHRVPDINDCATAYEALFLELLRPTRGSGRPNQS